MAAVYQHQDENGNIVFTDKKEPGSTERKVSKPAEIHINKNKQEGVAPIKTGDRESTVDTTKKSEKEKETKYSLLTIVQPAHDMAIRENSGNVSIVISAKPELQKKFGHKIKIALDGKWVEKTWQTNSLTLENINRGTHELQAMIVSADNKSLIKSKTIQFHLQRFSSLNRKN